jgi:hypothetical protein
MNLNTISFGWVGKKANKGTRRVNEAAAFQPSSYENEQEHLVLGWHAYLFPLLNDRLRFFVAKQQFVTNQSRNNKEAAGLPKTQGILSKKERAKFDSNKPVLHFPLFWHI